MNQDDNKQTSGLILPPSVASRIDMARLVEEIERIDSDLITRQVHEKVGVSGDEELRLSAQASDFLAANQIDIYDSHARTNLIQELKRTKNSAPTVHVTFATEADQDSLAKLIDWIRRSIHPQSLLVVGLQPSLVGGVYVRTANQVFDLSVRSQLSGGRDIIVKELEALSGGL